MTPADLVQDGEKPAEPWWKDRKELLRTVVLAALAVLLLYLCWRILVPFLTAISWAFALAVIAAPVYRRLRARVVSPTLASLLTSFLVIAVVIAPAVLLARSLFHEAAGLVQQTAGDSEGLRSTIDRMPLVGGAFRWLDERMDVAGAAVESLRNAAGSVSSALSSFVAGSIRVLGQIGAAIFILFYLLRDGEAILGSAMRFIPLEPEFTRAMFDRITRTLRVSLGGKFVTSAIQGLLGGAMFAWLGLPAPVFWGFIMGCLSLFPVIGAFLVWGPAAIHFLANGDWPHALLLTVWGVLVIHPVDNLLGPVLVGTTLRIHALLMFFSVLGGIAAFGASGIVIGPLVVAVVVSVFEEASVRNGMRRAPENLQGGLSHANEARIEARGTAR
jgi:predicted PurR-regulated permease PerM